MRFFLPAQCQQWWRATQSERDCIPRFASPTCPPWQLKGAIEYQKWPHRTKSLPHRSWKRLRRKVLSQTKRYTYSSNKLQPSERMQGKKVGGSRRKSNRPSTPSINMSMKPQNKYTIIANQGSDKQGQAATAIVDMADTIVIVRSIAN